MASDASFYGEYFAEMLPKVRRFISARFDTSVAEDLASETMLSVWRKGLPAPQNDVELAQLRSLTYKIAVGHICNSRRRSHVEARHADEGRLRVIPGDDPTFEAVVPGALAAAIATLEFADRQAVNLMIVGFRTVEIADILGITPKAASMRLARARQRLSGRWTTSEGGE